MAFTNPTTSFIQEYGATVQMIAQQNKANFAALSVRNKFLANVITLTFTALTAI